MELSLFLMLFLISHWFIIINDPTDFFNGIFQRIVKVVCVKQYHFIFWSCHQDMQDAVKKYIWLILLLFHKMVIFF